MSNFKPGWENGDLPVSVAKEISTWYKMSQVIIFGWDGKETYVTTYGTTAEDSANAARGANRIKKGWGWPEETLLESPRVTALIDQLKVLQDEVQKLVEEKKHLEEVVNYLRDMDPPEKMADSYMFRVHGKVLPSVPDAIVAGSKDYVPIQIHRAYFNGYNVLYKRIQELIKLSEGE